MIDVVSAEVDLSEVQETFCTASLSEIFILWIDFQSIETWASTISFSTNRLQKSDFLFEFKNK